MAFQVAAAESIDPLARPWDKIFRSLRDSICRNRIPTGTRILLQGVAEDRGASPKSVSDAFLLLAAEGLVERNAPDHATVLPISERRLRNVMFLREQAEVEIVRQVSQTADSDFLGELREQITRQKLVGLRGPRDLLRLDDRFHRTLADRVGHGTIWPYLEGWKLYNDRVRFTVEGSFTPSDMISQHSALVDRIAMRDAEGAAAAIRYHLRGALRRLPEQRLTHPDQFSD
ncbi:GntR family transcriptional regulator [Salipiger mangrovisoli]|uniref:GntR family transcriptional regulator n=1 Tax=Salipiger mangrovisoli TaxID=2865933 RepID=A0ABR9WXW8_9RHOB|nr:GntR family transcriptional regulator [Salipiger mangrovisoli]MBE9636095.1 GntR family transcriptional regulator [Salipiger mangrovisoli]